MYPNPSNTGKFDVELKNFTNKATIKIYNFYGRLIQYKNVNPQSNIVSIKMGDYRLRSGNYVVKVYSQVFFHNF